jgi:hypothetical protein
VREGGVVAQDRLVEGGGTLAVEQRRHGAGGIGAGPCLVEVAGHARLEGLAGTEEIEVGAAEAGFAQRRAVRMAGQERVQARRGKFAGGRHEVGLLGSGRVGGHLDGAPVGGIGQMVIDAFTLERQTLTTAPGNRGGDRHARRVQRIGHHGRVGDGGGVVLFAPGQFGVGLRLCRQAGQFRGQRRGACGVCPEGGAQRAVSLDQARFPDLAQRATEQARRARCERIVERFHLPGQGHLLRQQLAGGRRIGGRRGTTRVLGSVHVEVADGLCVEGVAPEFLVRGLRTSGDLRERLVMQRPQRDEAGRQS